MKLKKIEKFAIILTGLLFLTLTLYFLLCPVRTVGEVLAKDNLDSPDEIRINPTAPKNWSACDPFADLELGEGIWLSESEEIKEFCNLLYSLNIRKRWEKVIGFHKNIPMNQHTNMKFCFILTRAIFQFGYVWRNSVLNYLVMDVFLPTILTPTTC